MPVRRPPDHLTIETVDGYVLDVFRPTARPDLWRDYLDGAIHEYTRFDVLAALPVDSLEAADTVSLAFVISDDGSPIGGLRVHGPLIDSTDVAALTEMAASESVGRLRSHVASVLAREVVLETKGTWSSYDRADRRTVALTSSRCNVYALDLFNADRAFCTSPIHTVDLYEATGARIIAEAGVSSYPDDRYQTHAMEWLAPSIPQLADLSEWPSIGKERASLAAALKTT